MRVEMVLGEEPSGSKVQTSGSAKRIINDEDLVVLNLDAATLKRAVGEYLGRRPDEVYLRSPAPDNSYEKNHWDPVHVNLTPGESSISDFQKNLTVLKTQRFINDSSKDGTFDVSISEDVSDSVESNWSRTLGISFSQSISYGTKFVGGDTSISLQTDFQSGGSESKTKSVGQSSGVMVDLSPGESVTAQLSSSQGTATIHVEFEVFLSGVIVGWYKSRYKWKNIWPVDIAGALDAIGVTNKFIAKNDVALAYFSDGEIVLKDQSNTS